MPPIDIDARVIANARLSSEYSVLSLAAPEVGARTQPGQFVMVKPAGSGDPLLRRPFSVFEVLRDSSGVITGVSILNKRAGRSTRKLYDLEEGDIVSCLGPLGQPFKAVLPPAQALDGCRWRRPGAICDARRDAGREPDTRPRFSTARAPRKNCSTLNSSSASACRWCSAPRTAAVGTRGRVTIPLEASLKALEQGAQAMVYACGPEPMLEAVAKLAARYSQPSQVSVERVMGCGLGGCYSCVVPVKHGDEHANLVRSCISGPVFDGAELVWD